MNMGGGKVQGWLSTLHEMLRTYHVLDEKLKIIERDIHELSSEFKEVRLEHIKLEGRVARLEESKETIKAEIKRDVAEAVHRHEIEFIRLQSKMEVAYAKAEAEMKNAPLLLSAPPSLAVVAKRVESPKSKRRLAVSGNKIKKASEGI